jgi:hypothetical protein
LGNGFNDLALFVRSEFGPPAIQVSGLGQDFFAGSQLDTQEIEFGLESWDLVI